MPLTSIQCWHVHCEECWLRTLVRRLETEERVGRVRGTGQMFTSMIAPAWGRQGGAWSQELTPKCRTLTLGLFSSPLQALTACSLLPTPSRPCASHALVRPWVRKRLVLAKPDQGLCPSPSHY